MVSRYELFFQLMAVSVYSQLQRCGRSLMGFLTAHKAEARSVIQSKDLRERSRPEEESKAKIYQYINKDSYYKNEY
jgi:hypothetical protein